MRTDLKIMRDSPPWEWPKSAGRTFLKVIGDRRANKDDRLVATALAGDFVVVDEEICNALLNVLTDAGEDVELRATAAVSFGAVLEQEDTFGFDDPDDVPIDEPTFLRIQAAMKELYFDAATPALLRRKVLEASVRAPEEWHSGAISAAWASGERDLVLTAVFCMQYVKGFDAQILEALENPDPEIHYEAVLAAGSMGVTAARDHVIELVEDPATPKELLLAAIEAVGALAPDEASEILADLEDSPDEEIAEAVDEAISSAIMMRETDEGEEDRDEEDGDDEKPLQWVQ